jgi:signal peptidase II
LRTTSERLDRRPLARHDPRITAVLVAAALVTVDQASKALTGRVLADGRFHSIVWRSGFRRVRNRRAGLVALPLGWGLVIWTAGIACAAAAVIYGSPSLTTEAAIILGLALGGATSNLADRVLRGAVVDFIAVGRWPTFNLADAAMVTSVALLAGALL